MFFVSVMINTAQAASQTTQGTGVLTTLMAVNKAAVSRRTHANHNDLAAGSRQAFQSLIRNGIAVAEYNDVGAVLRPGVHYF